MNCYRCATPVPENSKFCNSCGADLSGESGEHTQPVVEDRELERKLQEDLKGEYVLERELGRGGMAAVFLGRDAHLGRKVAIKVLPPELTFGKGMVERFKREARTAATLDHPHIIPVYRVSTGGKLFWYAMKYLEGESLADVLQREHELPLERSADILVQAAPALDYAHQHGVVHRDVKPANVMIDASGWVTLTDFGIAKAVDTQSLTGSGSMIGTPYYMSPEQCAGKKVTGASDQYALGVVAYQMLSGHVPFTGESVVDIIKKHCMDPPPPLAVLRPTLPPALVAVVERSLAKTPEERFTTVAEFAKAFERAALGAPLEGQEQVGVRPRRISETALVIPVAVAELARGVRRWPLGGRRLAIFVTLGGIGAVGVGGMLLWPTPKAQPGSSARPSGAVTQQVAARPGSAQGEAPASQTTPAPAPAAPTAVPSEARLVLRGVPTGAVVALDGRAVRGTSFALRPGARHIVAVSASGFTPWADTIMPGRGEEVARTVRLRPLAQGTGPPTDAAAPAAPAGAPAAPAPAAATPSPSAAAPVPTGTPPTGMAYITVGSSPLAAMTINGRTAPSNPVVNFEVPAGPVRLHFTVTDTAGVWSFDTTVTVGAGERRNVGRIRLARP